MAGIGLGLGLGPRARTISGAADIPFSGALVRLDSDITGQNFTSATVIDWDSEVYEEGDWWDSGNPSRLTVPAGVSKIVLNGCLYVTDAAVDGDAFLLLYKNGVIAPGGGQATRRPAASTTPMISFSSAVLEVSEADYFELVYQIFGDTSVGLESDNCYFGIEKVE